MKDKKGFTLVELLAVIVILAIIALITTPIIMRVIKDARQKAALSSFRGYMDAVEKTIIRDSMKTTSELPSKDTNGCYNLKELDKFVKVKGTKPVIDDDDTLCISNGKIKSISEVIISGYKLEYKEGKILLNGKSAEGNVQIIEITNKESELYIGDKLQLSVSVTPSDANRTFTYTSSDTTKATVSNSGEVEAKAVGTVTITVTAKNGKKATKTLTIKEGTLYDKVELGDIIKMTPTKTSYTITSDLTGCTGSYCSSEINQTINPSQMKWWRVINKNNDGTIDMVSEYIQTDTHGSRIYLFGEYGYKNLVGALQTIASQYVNTTYTQRSRHFGYNGQTSTTSQSLHPTTAGATTTPALSGNGQEYDGGHSGDTLYAKDYNALIVARKTKDSSLSNAQALIGYILNYQNGNPTSSAMDYWLASRYYRYDSSYDDYLWSSRSINTSGSLAYNSLYYFTKNGSPYGSGHALRPVLTLKPNLKAVVSSEENVDWILE